MGEVALPEEYLLRLDTGAGRTVALICTNEALPELITGYLFNEGVILSPEEITALKIDRDAAFASVTLRDARAISGVEVRASGLGGVQLRSDAAITVKPLKRKYSETYIRGCSRGMDAKAVKYLGTGGVHCSALFDGEKMLSIFEDVGRHNTLDKLCGDCLLRGIPAEDALLITTGRISSDMVRKAGTMGVSVIASYSTPTKRAYDMAAAANITLIGYLKKMPMTVYCGGERIV